MGKSNKKSKQKWKSVDEFLESKSHSKSVPETPNNENSKMDVNKCLVQDKSEYEEPLKEGPKLDVESKHENNKSNLNDDKEPIEKIEYDISKSINKNYNKKIEESNKNSGLSKKIKTKNTSLDQNIITSLDDETKCENNSNERDHEGSNKNSDSSKEKKTKGISILDENCNKNGVNKKTDCVIKATYKNNDKSCDESGNNINSKEKKKSKNTNLVQKDVDDESKCENKSNEEVPEESNKNSDLSNKKKTNGMSKLEEKSNNGLDKKTDCEIKAVIKNNEKSCNESGNNASSNKKNKSKNKSLDNESKCENGSNDEVREESNKNVGSNKKKKTKCNNILDDKSKNNLDEKIDYETKSINKNNDESSDENGKNKSSNKEKQSNGPYKNISKSSDNESQSENKIIEKSRKEQNKNLNNKRKTKYTKLDVSESTKDRNRGAEMSSTYHEQRDTSIRRNSNQRLSHKEQNDGRNSESFSSYKNYNRNSESFSKSKIYERDGKMRNVHNKHKNNDYEDRGQSEVSEDGEQFLEEIDEDLFMLNKEVALAHCVAEDLRMGAGIAVDFKLKFGGVGKLLDQKLKIGDVGFVKRHEQYAFYLITKSNSSGKPTLKTVEMALESLLKKMKQLKLSKLGIPTIGCGLDGLDWFDVKSLVKKIFNGSGIHITVCVPTKILDRKAPPPLKVYMTSKNLWEMEPQTDLIIFIDLKNLSKKDFSDDVIDKVDVRYPFKEKLLKAVKCKKLNSGDIEEYAVGHDKIICAFFERETFYASVENLFMSCKLKYLAVQCKSLESSEVASIVLIFRSIRNNNELWLCNLCGDDATVEHGSSYDQYFRNLHSSYSSSFSYDSYSRPDHRNTSYTNNQSYSSNKFERNNSSFRNSSSNYDSHGQSPYKRNDNSQIFFSRGKNDRNSRVSSSLNSSEGNYNPPNRSDNKLYDNSQRFSWGGKSDPKCNVSSSQIGFKVNSNQLSQTDSIPINDKSE